MCEDDLFFDYVHALYVTSMQRKVRFFSQESSKKSHNYRLFVSTGVGYRQLFCIDTRTVAFHSDA